MKDTLEGLETFCALLITLLSKMVGNFRGFREFMNTSPLERKV